MSARAATAIRIGQGEIISGMAGTTDARVANEEDSFFKPTVSVLQSQLQPLTKVEKRMILSAYRSRLIRSIGFIGDATVQEIDARTNETGNIRRTGEEESNSGSILRHTWQLIL